ncbi:hypothetical protein ABDK00_014180 [Niabella insulamsoli]|uniref:hypothetical protein n=1 Tax=Niabella insulamsoli TaxID=3144874 RepID=UPI0031FE1519
MTRLILYINGHFAGEKKIKIPAYNDERNLDERMRKKEFFVSKMANSLKNEKHEILKTAKKYEIFLCLESQII